MTVVLNIFRRNLGLKIIALILALVIYYSMRNDSEIRAQGLERIRQHRTVGPNRTSEIQGIIDVPQNIFKKGSSDGGSGK